jgi:hypothetical protein
MKLQGSCHCKAIGFTLECGTPYPYLRCYCSICRKVSGGGGYAINLGGNYNSLKIEGEQHIRHYHKIDTDPQTGEKSAAPGGRAFCDTCGTALWNYDPRWPDLVHPFASAIDTPLPKASEITHIMLNYKPDWVPAEFGPDDKKFDEYPEESLADWHQRLHPG